MPLWINEGAELTQFFISVETQIIEFFRKFICTILMSTTTAGLREEDKKSKLCLFILQQVPNCVWVENSYQGEIGNK